MPSCKIKCKPKDIFTNYSTRNQSYKHLFEANRGEIEEASL